MRYLTFQQILLIHSMLIDEYGGSHGIRERGLLLSAEELPKQKAFGEELYTTVFIKAAVYARNIIMSHPFVDGNKRTGMTAAIVFLENNDHMFLAKTGEIEKFALKIIEDKLDLVAIAAWLKKHSRKSS